MNLTTVTGVSLSVETSTNASVSEIYVEPPLSNQRKRMPIFFRREEIIQKINDNPVVIIFGKTGCGKVSFIESLEVNLSTF